MRRRNLIKQRDNSDCGAACLSSIASHYQLDIPVGRVRQYAGTDKNGTTISGLIEAAEKLGFESKGAKGPMECLSKIPLPCIAHIVLENGLHHYVVIYKVTGKRIFIMDPGIGQMRKIVIEEFKNGWTGVIVLLVPGEKFIKKNLRVSNISRLWLLILPHSHYCCKR